CSAGRPPNRARPPGDPPAIPSYRRTSRPPEDPSAKIAAVRRVSDDERRARLGRGQFLAPDGSQASDAASVAGQLVGLHATDPATVFLSARARVPGLTVAGLEASLYEDRHLVRMLAMRRTLFVVPVALVPVLQAACT